MVVKLWGARRAGGAGIGAYLAAIFAVCLLSLGAIIGYSARSAFQREQGRAVGQVQSTAQFAAAGLASQLSTLPTFLRAIAVQPAVAALEPASCDSALASYRRFGLGFVSVVRADGTVVCTSEPRLASVPAPYAGQVWFGRALRGQGVDGTVTTNPLTGRPAFVEAQPIGDATGGAPAPAALVATLDPSFLSLGAQAPLRASDTELLVLDPSRHLILSASGSDQRYVGRSLARTALGRPLPGVTAAGPDGVDRIYAEAPVPGAGWHVVAGVPSARALASAWDELWRNLGLGAATLAVVAVLGLQLRRRISRPLRSLTATIERSGQGGPDVCAQVEGPAELARVAEAFNTMLEERREFEAFLAHLACHDGLTSLPNRSLLVDRLARELDEETGPDGRKGAVVVAFLDLDRFKLINDSYGHSFGDQMLMLLAARLQDAALDGEVVGRFGGDEFVVISPDLTGDPSALAERVTAALVQPFDVAGQEIFLSGSVGIATSASGRDPETLLAEADAAMYRAKEGGRPYAVFDAGMRSSAAARLSIEAGLHRAVERSELVLHYQPAVRLADGALSGVEALVRWHRPGEGLVPPLDFIPVAEQTGLIVPIGAWVLEEACRQLAVWREELTAHGLTVAVNVSARQLTHPGFVAFVARVLESTGLPASALTLEITESALIDDVGQGAATLAALRDMSVGVAVDDFGTGYSSLSYLQQFPVDDLKIDRSFISRLGSTIDGEAVLRSLIDLGHSLGMKVVAEGVEVADQLLSLRRMGCDVAQGFYISRPVPAPELELALAQGRVWELTPAPAH
ncbi:MAG TPA: EAL domain-containing protein [Acidimicrobiales bacterium]|nr:EAL domain-containing protein [Acidimicrobiales bacterium]